MKGLLGIVAIFLMVGCVSTQNQSKNISLPTKKHEDKPRIEVATPQSQSDSFMYVEQTKIINADGDWHKLYNSWVMPNADPLEINKIRFPEGEESAYKGQKALRDGFERFCEINSGVLKDSEYYGSEMKYCWVSEDDRIGYLAVSNPFKTKPERRSNEGDKYWSLEVEYGGPYHWERSKRVRQSIERRKSEKVSGVIELDNGDKFDFINFGTLEENLAIEVVLEGYLNRAPYPIQEVAYIDFYPEAGSSDMGILLKDGRFQIVNEIHFNRRIDENTIGGFGYGDSGLKVVVKKGGGYEVMNFSNLNGIKRIYVGNEDMAKSIHARKMQEFHGSLLAEKIERQKVVIANRKAKEKERKKREYERRIRKIEMEKKLREKRALINEKRRNKASEIPRGEQVCRDGNIKYQTCLNANYASSCSQSQTSGTLYGYIVNKFENGFLEMRIGGLSNIPARDIETYRRYGYGKVTLDGLPTDQGLIIRVDSLNVFACHKN